MGHREADLSDEELVSRFVGGDEAAFTTLMRRHERRVYGLALRVTGNRSDALDAAQDAFVTLFRKASKFQGRSAFSTWMYRLTVNAATDVLRRRARAGEPTELADVASTDPMAESRVDIQRAIAALPEDQRTAVVLRDVYGCSYAEIGEITGVAEGTVKSRIARGRQALGQLLTEQPPEQTRLTGKERPDGTH